MGNARYENILGEAMLCRRQHFREASLALLFFLLFVLAIDQLQLGPRGRFVPVCSGHPTEIEILQLRDHRDDVLPGINQLYQ